MPGGSQGILTPARRFGYDGAQLASATSLGEHYPKRQPAYVWYRPILLKKSAVIDGSFGHFATGFDAPALTFSTKLERYTIHRS